MASRRPSPATASPRPPSQGPAALLKQHWPQLGGKAISRILLDTATDLGEKGADQLYGAGLLNIEAAMKAQAPASALAAADMVLARYSSLTLSGPFGSGGQLTDAVTRMTVFDRYGRDFTMTGSARPRSRGSGLLAGAMLGAVGPPWLAGSANDTKLGFTSATVGPWATARSNRPATIAFSTAAGTDSQLQRQRRRRARQRHCGLCPARCRCAAGRYVLVVERTWLVGGLCLRRIARRPGCPTQRHLR
ncbi:hypothetical protein [Sphingomonas adhaesiva]|uniref:hypothetical protein n=1 Tax=Sphingomonas adhaesiva TaxID=28212 RepID=UPI002FF76910